MEENLIQIIILSLQTSSLAVLFGTLIGLPIGAAIGLFAFPGRNIVMALIYTLMGTPTVLIGVFVYLLLSRHGPLGELRLLFTPSAIVIAQTFLTAPVILGLTMSAVYRIDKNVVETLQSLGATRRQSVIVILKEAKKGIWTGIATAFGRAISEVGAVMLVGGNIEGHTRVMTTAIILETRQGNIQSALILGFFLLLVSFVVQTILMLGMLNVFHKRSGDPFHDGRI
ncbi:ABC transporter permease [Bacillaceae bacterium]